MIPNLKSAKNIPPLFVATAPFLSGRLRVAKGDRAGAKALFLQAESKLNKLRAAGENSILLRSVLLSVEAHLGHRNETQTLADSILETTQTDAWQFPNSEEDVARAYVALGDFDRAIPILKRVLRVPGVNVLTTAYLKLDPSWDPIRNDRRFQKLGEETR